MDTKEAANTEKINAGADLPALEGPILEEEGGELGITKVCGYMPFFRAY